MEASIASCSNPRSGTELADNAAVGSHCTNLAAATILKEDGALSLFVKFMSQDYDPGLQKHAARTLRNLAAAEERRIKYQILNKEGTLKGLVKCLVKHDKLRGLRKIAAQTLWELAFISPKNIANEERASLSLVKALSEHGKPGLQRFALLALERIRDYQSVTVKIENEVGAIGGLVKCLSAIDNPGLQQSAFWVLKSVVRNAEDSRSVVQKIAEENGAIAGVVKCLSAFDNCDLQERAAEVLWTLAENASVKVKQRIAGEDGVVTGLVKCMSAIDYPEVQGKAMWALNKLAHDDNFVKQRIVRKNGAIACLVKFLSENFSLQLAAVEIIASLAEVEPPAVKQRIAQEDGAISGVLDL